MNKIKNRMKGMYGNSQKVPGIPISGQKKTGLTSGIQGTSLNP
jgi:hypothetical protein